MQDNAIFIGDEDSFLPMGGNIVAPINKKNMNGKDVNYENEQG